jgi:hypothetical protein
MKKHQPGLTGLVFLIFFTSFAFYAQGQVTTATLSGVVAADKGKPLSSATVQVSFTDAGVNKILLTKSDGSWVLPNLRVGGPYTITTSYTGYSPRVDSNIYLNLGENTSLDIRLVQTATNLAEVTVTARSPIFDDHRTGASTQINSRLLRTLPTISRSADDYTRLTPSASPTYNGISFAGRNGQYNNFSLDGAVFNNPFGLDAPTPGGQTNAQPVSLDAIDQIQVNIAPYDVTQSGFTGAGVNTVTKSGTNKTSGTVYGFYRNTGMTGHKVDGTKFTVPTLNHIQAGASLGGALVKSKLFYFVNFETEQRKDEITAYRAQNASNAGQITTSRVLQSDLDAVSAILKNTYGYETGPYQGFNLKQTNYKWLAKLDWVINSRHSLSFTYNGLDAKQDKPAHPNAIQRRGPDAITLQFRNSGYQMVNKLHSFGLELKSNFGDSYANKFRAVFTTFRDHREPFSAPFPALTISKNGVSYIIAGHEPFSINNVLTQDALQLTDNFNIILAKHTITVGASYEQFKFGNSFNLTGYGFAVFGSTDIGDFLANAPGGSLNGDVAFAKSQAAAAKWAWYYLTVGQLAGYVQDEWKIASNFKLTYGVRIDKPLYFPSKARYNDGSGKLSSPTLQNTDDLKLFNEAGDPVSNGPGKDIDNTRMPTGRPLFSPRLGFNWDVKEDKTVQVRGGTGLFTGRFPFVWLGNAIGNPNSSFYNVTAKNFRWPQIWRSNLGVDYKLTGNTVLTVDVAYTKDVHAMMVRNYALGTPSLHLNSGMGDTRAVYDSTDKGKVNAYVFTNANTGYSFDVSFQVQQTFGKGWFLMGSYNYLISKDASSISAEISSDAFDRNPVLGNANVARNSTSLYGNTHRIVLAGIKRFDYAAGKYATTVSFFANWTSGNRFSYVYAGDVNNDGSMFNDVMYVPTQAEVGVMRFDTVTQVTGVKQPQSVQRTALESFIRQDKYLSKHRGQYTGKYAGTTPWFSQVDMRVLQDINFKAGKHTNTVQVSLDIVNAGNLISSKWGVRKYASASGYYQPVTYVGQGADGVSHYKFDPSQTSTFNTSPDLPSRWQMQVGLRYIF